MEKLAAAIALWVACSRIANKRLHTHTRSNTLFPLRHEGWAGGNKPLTNIRRKGGGEDRNERMEDSEGKRNLAQWGPDYGHIY